MTNGTTTSTDSVTISTANSLTPAVAIYTDKVDSLVTPLPDTLARVYVTMTTGNSCASTRTYSIGQHDL